MSEKAFSKLKLKQPSATRQENYQYLTNVWQRENMRTFEDVLLRYTNKHVVPTVEAMQKRVDF